MGGGNPVEGVGVEGGIGEQEEVTVARLKEAVTVLLPKRTLCP